MSNICEICKYDLINIHNLHHHRQFCSTQRLYEVRKYTKYAKCDSEFNSFPELSDHLFTCGKFMCFKCRIPFLNQPTLQCHIKASHNGYPPTKNSRTYKCAICKHICWNRRDLYNHRLNQNGGNGDVEEVPQYILDEPNAELRDTYVTNRNHIHA